MERTERNLFQTLNRLLIDTFSTSEKLNYCRFLLPQKEGQVSLVAKYIPCFSQETAAQEPFVTLCADRDGLTAVESRDYDAYYYGVSPAIDESVIIEAITQGLLADDDGLETFIRDHCHGFMLHRDQGKYLLPCAKLFTLSIAHNFGIKLSAEGTLYHRLLSYAETTMVEKSEKEGQLLLCGSPTEALFRELDEYRFAFHREQQCWVCCSPEDPGLSLRDIYKNKDNIVLLRGHTFYSGALLRILYIKDDFISYGNDTVSPLQFIFERSSYGTVYTFDNNYTAHPLLASCRDALTEMYREDDRCKRTLLSNTQGIESRADYIRAVNNYLRRSTNVNQMGVTGNLITSDDILLIGERENAAIDAGEIYPSVNGNAEVIDPNVRFYKLFANEDYPTIALDANRIDFYGELNREAYAELSITTRSDAWQCYGFTLSGIVPPEENEETYPFRKRRMHFNILCQQVCTDTFAQIVEKQKTATEAFENRDLKGLALSYYPSRRRMLWERFLSSCRVILDNESNVMTLAAVYVFISTIIAAAQNGSLTAMTFSLSDLLSALFALLGALMLVVVSLKAIKIYRFRRKHITKLHIVRKGDKDDLGKITKYFTRHSCHPVAYAAVLAHILKTAEYK